ncbi:uncharacterized protein KQ657_000062 [Scheffersomyces spartinae]|uniref:DBF4-type domain-containing protein n=1 Tax=Scheffersomyces spartinae TaxID=45513 RepID=A0A9P8AKP9_9ASCO|nr:uncharacterized protein KQ657_000062 [Scheffersomyces spartinae]KAG7196053.1 hypothetical protein KQ657_000062 [Scheffersomyces spartinae]
MAPGSHHTTTYNEPENQLMPVLANTTNRLPLQETSGNIRSPVHKRKFTEEEPTSTEGGGVDSSNSLQQPPAKLHGTRLRLEVVKRNLQPEKRPQESQDQHQHQHQLHQNHEQEHSKGKSRLQGADLYHWQQQWKRIMKESVVYFDGVADLKSHLVEEAEYKRAYKALKEIGCTITPFYDGSVTIIVSRRLYSQSKAYSQSDIFYYASKLKAKVWDYTKVFRFLKNLGVLDERLNHSLNESKPRLSSLLKEEKIFGSTDKDPNAKREDFHYLDKNFLFVYDLSQQVRPIAVREWVPGASYPTIYLTLDGKCPFIPDTLENSERKRLRRQQRFEAAKEYRLILKRASEEIVSHSKKLFNSPSKSNNDDERGMKNLKNKLSEEENEMQIDTTTVDDYDNNNENDHSTTREYITAQDEEESSNKVAELLSLRRPPALVRNSSCVQPSQRFFDVAASGFNGASNAMSFSMDSTLNSAANQGGNGLGPTMSQVSSRNFNNLKRRIVIKRQQLEKKQAQLDSSERDSKPGYCENCRVKYDCFADHIKSNRHRNFACDDRNFKDIDKLIRILNENKSLGQVVSNGDFNYA